MTMRDSPLERARKKGQIDEREYEAGRKFYHHWYHAGMAGQLTTLNLDAVFARDLSSMGHMPASERQAHHRQQFRIASELLGFRPGFVVLETVCNEVECEAVGRRLGFRNRAQARAAAVTLLQDGLHRLAKLWGM